MLFRSPERAHNPFTGIKDHVLLRGSAALADVDAEMTVVLTADVISGVLAMVPDAWRAGDAAAAPAAAEMRRAYERYLLDRLAAPRAFVEEAARAR